MRRLVGLAMLCAATSCSPPETLPDIKIPDACEQQVYADPAVREEIMKGAGSDYYRSTHQGDLARAKLEAVNRCMRQKGLAPQGGGVERPR